MTPPKTPKNEARRLEVLWKTDLLDTLPEEAFDDLTQLAASICGAPIATLTLVDEDRQWFKSKVGLSIQETARDISFCGHTILQSRLFIVEDALKDKRFADNPLVTSKPKIRFYAGAPLVTSTGEALGALCVIDKVPRTLNEDQQKALRTLARHVVALLELRQRARDKERLEAEHARLAQELAQARRELEQSQRPRAGARKRQ
jgi:GAF domain-containing protein